MTRRSLNLRIVCPRFEWDLVHKRCLELESAGLIRRSESTFAAPTVMPAKKDSDDHYTEKRMCGDYRALNDKTAQDRHPMPLAEDIFDQMSGSCITAFWMYVRGSTR